MIPKISKDTKFILHKVVSYFGLLLFMSQVDNMYEHDILSVYGKLHALIVGISSVILSFSEIDYSVVSFNLLHNFFN